jgi:hypothetical protein
MKEVVFVSDIKTARTDYLYKGWDLFKLLFEMREAAKRHGHSEEEFGLVVVGSGDDLFDVLWGYADKSPRYMEFVLHGARGVLKVNDVPMTTADFCQWIFQYGIQPQVLVIRACGQRSSDYDFLRDMGIDVRIGGCGSDIRGTPIFSPYKKGSTGQKIWEYYRDEYYPTEKTPIPVFSQTETAVR